MRIYLDNAATTPVDHKVFKVMVPFFSGKFGNASEPHSWGQKARKAIEQARKQVAGALGAKAKEIIFTSCATESINLAHKGLVESLKKRFKGSKLPHVITSQIEHKAVLETCKHLEKLKMADVTYLPVDKHGMVRVQDLKKTIRPETVLVSLMYVNNEVGTIEPIEKIGKILKRINELRLKNQGSKIYFHTDATQAIQYLNCNVRRLGVDLLSLTGHKIYAPKGIGALYKKAGTPLVRQQDGGGQEFGLRSGTENVPYIVALGKAIKLVTTNRPKIAKKVARLRDKLTQGVLKISDVSLTGHPKKRAPHIASFVVKDVEGEAMLLLLSDKGIAAATGSACTSGSLEPSHVLTAMSIPPQLSHGSLRLSLSLKTTEEEIDYVLEVLPKVIKRLRKMAPKNL